MNPTGFCLLCLLIPIVSAEPREYDLRIKENRPLEFRKYGDSDAVDYFRLLEVDDSHLIIGAADNVHNISIDQFERISLYEWPSGENDIGDCIMKIDDQTACRNYVRVLSRSDDDGTLLICGTNAFRPLCRLINSKHEKLVEFVGTGISPLDPRHNTSFLRDGDLLYSATVADFDGNDALVFRRNITRPEDRGIRTQRQNIMLLNKPQFVGTLQSEKYIYFFFREEATEASDATTHSRVARVCKNDKGGPQGYETEWTTFAKARLNCSILEKNKPFYFDEIISVSGITHNWQGKNKNLVYATFVSEFNFLRHSVVCAFGIDEIDKLFGTSDILTKDFESGKWRRKGRQDHQGTSKLGQCNQNSRDLSEEEVIQMRKTPLLADSVPNLFGKAVGIHRGSDNYNQIVVLEGVHSFDGPVDVLYVGTDQGNVIKMINLGRNGTEGDMDTDPIHQVSVFKISNLPIRRLLITQNRYLIVVTDPVVYRLPLHLCSSYESCDECISSRDPHCYWKQGQCRSITSSFRPKLSYQDVLSRQPNICSEAKKHDKPKEIITTTEMPKTEMPKISKEKYRNITFGALTVDGNEVCNCTALKSNVERRKCHCPNIEEMVQPVISEELSVSPWSRVPWWVFLILVLAFLQTMGLLLLCIRLRRRRMAKKKGQSSQKQMLSVINAYAPTITDAIPPKIGPTYATYDTFRR